MKNDLKVPYDNDPRPLKPANPNLKEVREYEGPNPTQDGPYRGRNAPEGANDLMEWLDAKSPLFNYLGPAEDKAVKE
jgi:hypothetical protein